MMLPASTLSPPYFFTPSRLPAESRPFREEPPAFLCAIESCSCSGGGDVADAEHRQVLPVTTLPPVILPTLLLEDDDLVRARLLQHRRGHAGARHGGGAQ